jgi:hypothetical protein
MEYCIVLYPPISPGKKLQYSTVQYSVNTVQYCTPVELQPNTVVVATIRRNSPQTKGHELALLATNFRLSFNTTRTHSIKMLIRPSLRGIIPITINTYSILVLIKYTIPTETSQSTRIHPTHPICCCPFSSHLSTMQLYGTHLCHQDQPRPPP